MSQPKPKLAAARVNELLAKHAVTQPAAVLAVRAYRRDTMGAPGRNDVGIYDDAMFIRDGDRMLPFNANCDPSRIGWNAALGKPFAQLKTGVWPFIKGLHKGEYAALRQPYEEQAVGLHLHEVFDDDRGLGHFIVIRDDGKGRKYEDSGYHAINIHRGGINGTSSWGCQTLPPLEWPGFISAVYEAMKRTGQRWIPYCLIDGPVV